MSTPTDTPTGQKYCWSGSHYKPADQVPFGGRCWDCVHVDAQRTAAREALDLITTSRPANALYVLAAAVDEQAAREGIELPRHQSVARHAARLMLSRAVKQLGTTAAAARAVTLRTGL